MDIAHLNVVARDGLDGEAPAPQLRALQTSLKRALLYYSVAPTQRDEAWRLIDAIRLRLAHQKLAGKAL